MTLKERPKTAHTLHRHFEKRWAERVGSAPPETAMIEALIRSGQTESVVSVSKYRTVHAVRIEGKVWPVVYDKKRSSVCTILPRGSFRFPPVKPFKSEALL